VAPRPPETRPDLARLLANAAYCQLMDPQTSSPAGQPVLSVLVHYRHHPATVFTPSTGRRPVRRRLVGGSPGAAMAWRSEYLDAPPAWGRDCAHPTWPQSAKFPSWAKQILEAAGAGIMAVDTAALAQTVRHLLDHPRKTRRVGPAGPGGPGPHQERAAARRS